MNNKDYSVEDCAYECDLFPKCFAFSIHEGMNSCTLHWTATDADILKIDLINKNSMQEEYE